MRSGAPSTASDATEPANMPNSKPKSAAMRAETASCTEAGCTHAPPARISRNRMRRALQRDGILSSLMAVESLAVFWAALHAPARYGSLGAARRQQGMENTGDYRKQEEFQHAPCTSWSPARAITSSDPELGNVVALGHTGHAGSANRCSGR